MMLTLNPSIDSSPGSVGYVAPAPPSLSGTNSTVGRRPYIAGIPQIPDAGAPTIKNINDSGASTTPILWNPPAHNLTKPPRIAWQNYDLSKEFAQTTNDVVKSWDNGIIIDRTTVRGRLGALYTDPWMMDVGGGFVGKNRWGVQFHYNPTSITVSGQADPSIAALTIGQSGSILGNGTISVSLELYFNRIYDLSDPSGSNYPTKLSKTPEDQLRYIQQFGTEYDIEYLYRVCNGDPRNVRGLSHKTADFGFLTQSLVRLDLGPFKYIGTISSMEIDHLLFTPTYIPTFTKVSISFLRQITVEEFGTNNGAQKVTQWAGAVTGSTSS